MAAIGDSKPPGNISFGLQRRIWLDCVLYDVGRKSPLAFAIAYAISSWMREDQPRAYPSDEQIALKVGASARSVRRTRKLLCPRWLQWRKRQQGTNLYTLNFAHLNAFQDMITVENDMLRERFSRNPTRTPMAAGNGSVRTPVAESKRPPESYNSAKRNCSEKRDSRERVHA